MTVAVAAVAIRGFICRQAGAGAVCGFVCRRAVAGAIRRFVCRRALAVRAKADSFCRQAVAAGMDSFCRAVTREDSRIRFVDKQEL